MGISQPFGGYVREMLISVGAFLAYLFLTIISVHFLMLKGYRNWGDIGALPAFLLELTRELPEILGVLSFSLVLMTGLLFATNIFFLRRILKNSGKPVSKKLFGISASASLLFTGCACGISFLSFLGLGSIFLFLPWQGIEVSLVAIAILAFTLYKNIQTLYSPKTCKI